MDIKKLQQTIKYHFKNEAHLMLALTHKSFGNENSSDKPIASRDNERLEFLGDAVLDLVVTEMLLQHYPDLPEGDLSKIRASIVNEHFLALVAVKLELGQLLILGKGEEQTGGREKESITSSCLEAVLASVYLDGGYAHVKTTISGLFEDAVKSAARIDAYGDYKTKLQEVVQGRYKCAPTYDVIDESGPEHDKTFEVGLWIKGDRITKGSGKSKKEAEQSAAKLALEVIEEKKE